MISKRTRRYSQPQEQLKQFALNNSKGIDETKAITDSDTVFDTVNLTINDDGSMSLRPPLTPTTPNIADDYNGNAETYEYEYMRIPMFDGVHVLELRLTNSAVDPKLRIVDMDTAEGRNYCVKSTNYYTFAEETFLDTAKSDIEDTDITGFFLFFRFDEVQYTNTPTSTILNGVKVPLATLTATDTTTIPDTVHRAADAKLYSEYTERVTRRLIITRRENVGTRVEFDIRIHTPEPSQLEGLENGSVRITTDMMLDNPYAIRDNYNTTVPRIRGVTLWKSSDKITDIEEFKANHSVATIFENVSRSSDFYSLVSSIQAMYNTLSGAFILKAFCDIPSNTTLSFAARWSYSLDNGVTWDSGTKEVENEVENEDGTKTTTKTTITVDTLPHSFAKKNLSVAIEMPITEYDTLAKSSEDSEGSEDSGDSENSTVDTVQKVFFKLQGDADTLLNNNLSSRPDMLLMSDVYEALGNLNYSDTLLLRFDIVQYAKGDSVLDPKKYVSKIGSSIYSFPIKGFFETASTDASRAYSGKLFYYGSTLYTYGAEEQSLIYVSDAGVNITPYTNSIKLTTIASSKTVAMCAWRNYLIAFTERTVHLLQRGDEGMYVKTINASIGVPSTDSETVVSTPNGVFFKNNDRIYFGYPNVYAGTDNIFQFTDISKPVHSILSEKFNSECFATFGNDTYVLMCKDTENSNTNCIIYNMSTKTWEFYIYPALFDKVYFKDARLFAFSDTRTMAGEYCLSRVTNACKDTLLDKSEAAIQFSWDTGQKTDSISETKQFVESKLMFATLSETDAFPFTLYVAIDGDPHVTKKDVSTDAPFWKPAPANASDPTLGVLNTSFRRVEDGSETLADSFNVLRQLVVRYSGKGKSIRHLIEGESQSNFKLYETYVRYKPLSNR